MVAGNAGSGGGSEITAGGACGGVSCAWTVFANHSTEQSTNTKLPTRFMTRYDKQQLRSRQPIPTYRMTSNSDVTRLGKGCDNWSRIAALRTVYLHWSLDICDAADESCFGRDKCLSVRQGPLYLLLVASNSWTHKPKALSGSPPCIEVADCRLCGLNNPLPCRCLFHRARLVASRRQLEWRRRVPTPADALPPPDIPCS
jgi:hypothetical protein